MGKCVAIAVSGVSGGIVFASYVVGCWYGVAFGLVLFLAGQALVKFR